MLGDILIDFPPCVFNSFFFEPSAHKLARLADQQALGTQQSLPTPELRLHRQSHLHFSVSAGM